MRFITCSDVMVEEKFMPLSKVRSQSYSLYPLPYNLQVSFFLGWWCVVVEKVTSVLEEHTAFILRVEIITLAEKWHV
jgi:hypothetical protein